MLNNYLTILWRTISRQPAYALLNLSCLTIGIIASLLILLYLDFELNYDRFHVKADHIYRVETPSILREGKLMEVNWVNTPALTGHFMHQDYPEIEEYTRVYKCFQEDAVVFETDEKTIEEPNVYFVDSTILNIFSLDFIHGNPSKALHGPDKIIINETLAERLFGNENPVGKTLTTELTHVLPDAKSDYSLAITGVYRDLPRNSHLPLHALVSAESDPKFKDYYFRRFAYATYALLQKDANPAVVAPKLSDLYEKHLNPDLESMKWHANHSLIPLTDIHINESGGMTYIWIFAGIGFLLLLISIISYVNLVTAQASKRSMEVGIRKVMGGNRQQLIVQFLSESMMFTCLAFLLALCLTSWLITPLNGLFDLQLEAANLWHPQLMMGMAGLLFVIGILGGSYPAFFLASFQPISIMKGKTAKGAPLRRVLVAVQFAVVIFVLVSTGMIYEQLQFLRNKDLGFDQEQVVRLAFPSEEGLVKLPVLKDLLKQSPLISSAGTSSFNPGVGMTRRPFSADGSDNLDAQFAYYGDVDYDYFATMDMEILEGRNYSPEHQEDAATKILVNETFGQQFGLKELIGQKIRFGDKGNPNFVEIIGVVKDFHQNNLHHPIAGQVFLLSPASYNLAVKIDQNVPEALAHIEQSWAQVFPNEALNFRFMDEVVQAGYDTDKIRGHLFLLLSILTVLITFLGLFGLASYMVSQRIKEIGIRRVLGATLSNVVTLIAKDFLILVVLAALPAFGFTWYFINEWLQDFAYRTEMNYLIFGLVLIGTLVLTLGVTGLHAVRATGVNPAESLKSE